MPITEAQRQQRQKHIGSSDMAAILGLDRFRSAYDVWLEKTGQVEPAEENEAMYAGNAFETGVLQYAEDHLGPILRNQYRSNPELHLGANIDAILRTAQEPIDAKTSGLFGPLDAAWGDGADEVPPNVIIQAHVHMLCMGGVAEQCHIAAFLGGRGFRLYRVPRDGELAQSIGERAIQFWQHHVLAEKPPEGVPSLEFAKQMHRRPGKWLDSLDESLVQQWEHARQARLDAEKAEKEAQAALLAALGDAEAAPLSDGRELVYLEQNGAPRCDIKSLRNDHPELAKEYITQGTHRVLRARKKKT